MFLFRWYYIGHIAKDWYNAYPQSIFLYIRQILVSATGFEPTTLRLQGHSSNHYTSSIPKHWALTQCLGFTAWCMLWSPDTLWAYYSLHIAILCISMGDPEGFTVRGMFPTDHTYRSDCLFRWYYTGHIAKDWYNAYPQSIFLYIRQILVSATGFEPGTLRLQGHSSNHYTSSIPG